MVLLGEVCKPKQWPTLSKAQMTTTGYPVYGANGRIGFSPSFTHAKPVVLIGCRGSCGTVHITEPMSYANGNAMALDQLDVDRVEPGYLARFLRQRGLRDVTTGSSQPQIIRAHLVRVEIPLPSLSEQRRIADVLDRADALRTKCRRSLALLDDLTRSIFLEMFGDPVMNQRGWPTGLLGELGHLNRGVSKHRPRNSPELLGGPYPFVQTGDVANSGGYITAHGSSYSALGLAQSKLWPAGILCITIAANIAKTGVLTFDACFPDSVVGFDSDPATTSYVQVWLSFLQKTLEDSAPESAQKNINLAILRNLQVPIPPLDVRESFDERRRAVEILKNLQSHRLTMLDFMVEALCVRAFSGEL